MGISGMLQRQKWNLKVKGLFRQYFSLSTILVMLAWLKVRCFRKLYFSKKLQLKKKKEEISYPFPGIIYYFYTVWSESRISKKLCYLEAFKLFCELQDVNFSPFLKQQFSHDIRHRYARMQLQKQPYRGALTKRISNETALCHGCSPVNLLQIFRTSFPNNTFGGLLLQLLRKFA